MNIWSSFWDIYLPLVEVQWFYLETQSKITLRVREIISYDEY